VRRVAVLVEGPSDLVFWQRIFYRFFGAEGTKFDVRSLNGVRNLIRRAPTLASDFRGAKYSAAIVILDADEASCARKVLELFDSDFQKEASEPLESRFVHICIAFRELESWVLADENSMRALVYEGYEYQPGDAAGGKARLSRLCKRHGCPFIGMENREFAKQVAQHFDPEQVRQRSASFNHVWSRLSKRLA
jgi:hypothetical protein